jgi:exonuclease SbcC
MIKTLLIKNFQSHRETRMEFVSGTNVIVGESDTGKSAIIRALRLVIFNRPQGDAIRSRWGDQTSVLLILDDGQSIERVKGDKENFYRLNDQTFHAIKTEVPAEIMKVLNMDEGNIQFQFSHPFLLDASPGEVARHFNNVAQLSVIDISLSNVESWRREIERDIKVDTARKEELEEQLEEYRGLEKLDGRLTAIEQAEQHRNALANKHIRLKELLEELENIARRIQLLRPILVCGEEVLRLQKVSERRELVGVRRGRLADFLTELRQIELKRKEYRRVSQFQTRVETLLINHKSRQELQESVENLGRLIRHAKSVEESLDEVNKRRTRLDKEFKMKFPKVCPLCGRKTQ